MGRKAKSAKKDRIDLKPRPSCPSAAAGLGEDINGLGTPDGMTCDCIGGPFRCADYQM